MSVDLMTVLTILAMGAATYLVRAGGFFVIRRVQAGPFLTAWMKHVPGAIFVSLVVPAVVAGGPAAWAGGGITATLAALRLPFVVSLGAGVATVAAVRLLMPVAP